METGVPVRVEAGSRQLDRMDKVGGQEGHIVKRTGMSCHYLQRKEGSSVDLHP